MFNIFENSSIKSRMIAMASLLVVSALLQSAGFVVFETQVRSFFDPLAEVDIRLLSESQPLNTSYQLLAKDLEAASLTLDISSIPMLEERYYRGLEIVKEQLQVIQGLIAMPEHDHAVGDGRIEKILKTVNVSVQVFEENDAAIFESVYALDGAVANELYLSELQEAYQAGSEALTLFTGEVNASVRRESNAFSIFLTDSLAIFMLMTAVLTGTITAICYLVAKSITASLGSMVRFVADIEKNRGREEVLDGVPCVERGDEIGTLARVIRDYLQADLDSRKLSRDLASKLQSFFSAVNESTQAVKEISRSMNQQFNSTKELNDMADKTQQSIDEVSHSVEESKHTAKSLFTTVQTGRNLIDELSADISEVAKLSSRIHNITASIGNVANQTNMLAINAAIESARAGEYGRGFGVVAEEVVKLADNTGVLSREIVVISGEISDSISRGVGRADKLRASFDEVFAVSEENEKVAESVSASLAEQKGMHKSIQEAAGELKRIGLSTSTSSQEIANSMTELSAGTRETHDMLNSSIS